mmetsp:Transcript_21563/g.45782  ORF Transcript_21563/g.45782 Transcript_21563/m.45782 type:complete len:255 (-) Transcript_21563:259-1023(-)
MDRALPQVGGADERRDRQRGGRRRPQPEALGVERHGPAPPSVVEVGNVYASPRYLSPEGLLQGRVDLRHEGAYAARAPEGAGGGGGDENRRPCVGRGGRGGRRGVRWKRRCGEECVDEAARQVEVRGAEREWQRRGRRGAAQQPFDRLALARDPRRGELHCRQHPASTLVVRGAAVRRRVRLSRSRQHATHRVAQLRPCRGRGSVFARWLDRARGVQAVTTRREDAEELRVKVGEVRHVAEQEPTILPRGEVVL